MKGILAESGATLEESSMEREPMETGFGKDVVERFRASRKKSEEADYKDGLESGKRWLMHHAKLRDLARLQQSFGAGVNASPGEDGFSAEAFLTAMDPETFGNSPRERESFWRTNGGDWDPTDAFVHGFCDAVLPFFDEVRDQV